MIANSAGKLSLLKLILDLLSGGANTFPPSLLRIQSELGPTFGIWNTLFVTSDADREYVLGSPDIFARGDLGKALGKMLGPESILINNGPEWKKYRDTLNKMSHPRMVRSFSQKIGGVSTEVMASWGNQIEAKAELQRMTSLVIARTMLGNMPTDAALSKKFRHLFPVVPYILARQRLGWLAAFLMPGKAFAFARYSPAVKARLTEIINARLTAGKTEEEIVDILDLLIEKGFNLAEIMSQLLTFEAAGYDTTASVNASALATIASDPELQAAIQHELDLIDGPLTAENIKSLPLLRAVINMNTLGNPPAFIIPRQALIDCVLPSGVKISAGTTVIFFTLGAGREFMQQFGQLTPYQIAKQHGPLLEKEVQRSFGYGQHFCIGFPLAMLQGPILLGEMLRRYTIDLPQDFELEYVFKSVWEPKKVTLLLTSRWN